MCVCQSELTELFGKLTEFATELSELSLPEQHSRNTIVFRPFLISNLQLAIKQYQFDKFMSEICSDYCYNLSSQVT